MSSEQSPDRRRAIPTQRGRKRQKLGGTLQRFWAYHRIGPPRSDTRPAAARQPKGEYQSIPDTVVDHRPPVPQKPLTASALTHPISPTKPHSRYDSTSNRKKNVVGICLSRHVGNI